MKKVKIYLLLAFSVHFAVFFGFGQNDQNIKLIVATGHSGSPSSIAFSPNGKILASGSSEYSVKLWNAEKGQQLAALEGHMGSVWSVKFSPDGKMLASGSSDKTIKIWNIENGHIIQSLEGHNKGVMSVVFSPDGKTLASSSEDKTVKLWDIGSGKLIKTFEAYSGRVWSVAFSPDGTILASGNEYHTIMLWDISNGQIIKSLEGSIDFTVSSLPRELSPSAVTSLAFSPDGKTLAGGGFNTLLAGNGFNTTVKLWDIETGEVVRTFSDNATAIAFSPDGKLLAGGSADTTIKLWNVENGMLIKTLQPKGSNVTSVIFSPDGKMIASCESFGGTIKFWDVETGKLIKDFQPQVGMSSSVALSPDKKILAFDAKNSISLFHLETGEQIKLEGHTSIVSLLAFSLDGKTLRSASWDGTNKLWSVEDSRYIKNFGPVNWSAKAISPDGKLATAGYTVWFTDNGETFKSLENFNVIYDDYSFSPDGKTLAGVTWNGFVSFWNLETGKLNNTFKIDFSSVRSMVFSPDGSKLAFGNMNNSIMLLDVKTVQSVKTFNAHNSWIRSLAFSNDGRLLISSSADGTIKFWDLEKNKLLATLIPFNTEKWVITTPDGRFDTNKSLDQIVGLHWIVNDEILKPLPLDVFMRQYFEPKLLPRLLKCTQEDNCSTEFNKLPSISEINRVQPTVKVKEIKPDQNSSDVVNVTIEVENVTEEIGISSVDWTKKKSVSSGAFDLRLFRDGQLVAGSAMKEKLEKFIADAPRLVAETKASQKLVNTPEDIAWREANDIFKLTGENVKKISPTKIQYTFRNIKLPRDGRETVEFTAYAFNSDKVKSATTEAVKFTIPKAVQNQPKKGRVVLISIGVNASENPAYDLRYAANDARKMQNIIGARLQGETGKFSEVVAVPLVSDYKTYKTEAVNHAQKQIIKGVFALLEGKSFKEIESQIAKTNPKLAEVFKSVPNIEKLKQIEPEDTLIITYAGHGYADNAGIFYLLPHDIGRNTTKLTTENLRKTISSDELSLWMQDITAAEMILIIDACHSATAVQGEGFKPGPMASRGLGQLSYDKDMKILSATQANNVALESNCLDQGLLSYSLLKDGITSGLADANKDRKLFVNEWLSYAEVRVPELFQEIKDEKRRVIIDGKCVFLTPRDVGYTGNSQKSNLDLQRPTLFNFKRRNIQNLLFNLP